MSGMLRCPKCGYTKHDKRKLRRQIRKYLKEGMTQGEAALLLDITQSYVSKIANGKDSTAGPNTKPIRKSTRKHKHSDVNLLKLTDIELDAIERANKV